MSGYLQWIVLTILTGSPLFSAVLLLVFWGLVGQSVVGLPGPVRRVMRWTRVSRLRRALLANPHDRRTRFELAELLVEQRRYGAAMEMLRGNLEAGEHDAATLCLMGTAALGAGHVQQGETLLGHAEEEDPKFRMGELDRVRGHFRLKRKDFAGAKEALERFCAARPGTVEGKVLLAQACLGLGDDVRAAELKQSAWEDHISSPRFQQRMNRLWAWRAQPWRPVLYLTVALLVFGVLYKVSQPQLRAWAEQQQTLRGYPTDDEEP